MDRHRAGALVQRKVILQSLYSGRALLRNVAFFQVMLAQARTDVLKALIFGNTIVVSAESFYDSPIAIRIFGEIFDEIGPDFCEKYGWAPLELHVETRSAAETPAQFLIERWSNLGPYFHFFRASDESIDPKVREDFQRTAAQTLVDGSYDDLQDVMKPLCEPYVLSDAGIGAAGRIPLPSISEYPSLLTRAAISNMQFVENYLLRMKRFKHLGQSNFDATVKAFSQTDVIAQRGLGLIDRAEREMLLSRNNEFARRFGTALPMSIFLREGPTVYGEQFDLARFWVEKDFHMKRLSPYDAVCCIAASDYEPKGIFDADTDLKEVFDRDDRLDDDGSTVVEEHFRFEWSVLKDLVASASWRGAISAIRKAKTQEQLDAAAERVLDVLKEKLVEFHVTSKKGVVSVQGPRLASFGALGLMGAGYVIANVLHMSPAQIALLCGGPIAGLGLATGSGKIIKAIWPAAKLPTTRFAVRQLVDWQFRNSVVPNRRYLPPPS